MCVDYDPPTVFREEWRHARKAHRCDECRRSIDPGERYRFVTGMNEPSDPWWQARQCEQCAEAARWLVVVCSGYLLTDVLDELAEHMEEPYPIATWTLGRIICEMRHQWAHRGPRRPAGDVSALVDKALGPWRARQEQAA